MAIICDDVPVDTQRCEHCSATVPIEDAVPHVDIYLCAACDSAWRAAFAHCRHRWVEPAADEHGDPGRYCERCGAIVTHDSAVVLFPLICDGWVPDGPGPRECISP